MVIQMFIDSQTYWNEHHQSSQTLDQRRDVMKKIGMLIVIAGLFPLLFTGCAAKLSSSDQAKLDEALVAAESANQSALRAEAAAKRAEAAAQRAEASAQKSVSAANRAEDAAKRAERAADSAEMSANKAAKAFELSQQK
jgi:hypothetical protein